ncbi:MAG TPA: L,D-transpeptidase [Polyangia bacterium]|jgi:hypothetical protein
MAHFSKTALLVGAGFALALGAGVAALPGCDAAAPPTAAADDLPLGDQGADDMKADGDWGAALTCKPVPDLPRLANPKIFVSLQGLTLRLVDAGAGFEKVFPIGPGAMDLKAGSSTYGESLSYYPLKATGGQDFVITPDGITPCKTWHTDAATGQRSPVFAGLPFLSWFGSYGIHGPIDNYRAPNGGNLRRGFVSHGCLRMEAADVLEVYARIKGVARVPVHVQREPERDGQGRRVDVPDRWIGAECDADADCNFTGGVCRPNAFSGRGYCAARCTSSCADKAGYPTTFCMADPDAAGQGLCVTKETPQNYGCRPLDHFEPQARSRPDGSATATVCVPGSPGWIGDRCLADGDCRDGNRCAAGLCTRACAGSCPDQPGWPTTTCVAAPELGGASCARTCTPASNASECPAATTCVERARAGAAGARDVCLPL